jgi:hypothetical protein
VVEKEPPIALLDGHTDFSMGKSNNIQEP